MGNRQKCSVCGDWIANAIDRTPHEVATFLPPGTPHQTMACIARIWGPLYVCADCANEGHGEPPQYNRDRGSLADMRYNGGNFNAGEW
jgi:hypothetical protein